MASRQVLWQQGQPVACAAVASKDTEQELQMDTLAVGGGGQRPFWPGRQPSGPWGVQSLEGLSEKDMEPGAGSPPSAPNGGEKQEAEIPRRRWEHTLNTTARPGWCRSGGMGFECSGNWEGRRGSLRFPFICCLTAAAGGWIRWVFPGTSLETQWLRLCAPSEEGTDIIPGWGTKVLHATRCSQKEKKTRQVFPPGAHSTEGEGQGSTLSPAALDSLFPVASHCWDFGHKEFWGRWQP